MSNQKSKPTNVIPMATPRAILNASRIKECPYCGAPVETTMSGRVICAGHTRRNGCGATVSEAGVEKRLQLGVDY